MTSTGAMHILILRAIEDPKVRYITAKTLVSKFPDSLFSDWKNKIDAGESIVLGRAENAAELQTLKQEFEAMQAPVEIVQQQSIGGKPVF